MSLPCSGHLTLTLPCWERPVLPLPQQDHWGSSTISLAPATSAVLDLLVLPQPRCPGQSQLGSKSPLALFLQLASDRRRCKVPSRLSWLQGPATGAGNTQCHPGNEGSQQLDVKQGLPLPPVPHSHASATAPVLGHMAFCYASPNAAVSGLGWGNVAEEFLCPKRLLLQRHLVHKMPGQSGLII